MRRAFNFITPTFFTTFLAVMLGIVMGTGIAPAYADPGDVDDNPPGLFEIGWNEDTLEDVDLDILKGPNSGTKDPRANILGCVDADEAGSTIGDCRDESNELIGSSSKSNMPFVLPPGKGPDWGDLFTGVMNAPEPGYFYVVPSFTDAVDFDGTYITPGSDGEDDYLDYGAITAVFVGDHISAGNAVDDTTMVSSGSDSNDDQITTYAWGTDSVPSKDDITNTYCYATTNDEDELIIYCGVERLSNDGASHVDVELNANFVGLDEEPPCDKSVCYMVGDRVDGDLMVSLDFTNGGDFGSLEIRKWNDDPEASGGQTWGDPVVELTSEGCNPEITNGTTIPAGAACAFNNNDDIYGGPWPNFIKDVVPIDTDPGFTDGMLPRNAFSEFGLNVEEILGEAQCISYIQVKTRTSHSFTSQLKDFAVRPFPICGSSVRTEIHADNVHEDIQGTTIKVGPSIHDFAEVMVTGPGIEQDPTGVVDFYLYGNDSCEGTPIGEDLGVPLDGGANAFDNTATAESKDFNLTEPKSYSFHADFISNNPDFPSSSLPLEHCEVITFEKYPTEVSTQIHQEGGHSPDLQGETVYVGLTIHDHAYVVSPGYPSAPVPTGNIDFKLFETIDCTGSFTAITGALDGNGEAVTSSTFTPAGDTALSYSASYAGDGNYLPSSESGCEPLNIIKYDSELATQIHEGTGHSLDLQSPTEPINVLTTIHDHAYWNGILDTDFPGALDLNSNLPAPTGDVSFELFRTIDCSGEASASFGGISWPQSDGLSEILHPAYDAETALFTPPAGDMSIKASWAEDSNYHESTSACEPLKVNKVAPSILTKVIVRDRAEVTGGLSAVPTGNVTIKTYRSNDCSGDAVNTVILPLPTSGAVEQSTALEQTLEVGDNVASYLATYEGDDNYLPRDHDCELVQFSVLTP